MTRQKKGKFQKSNRTVKNHEDLYQCMEDSKRMAVKALGSERGSLSSSFSDNCKLEEGETRTEEMYILIFISCYILSIRMSAGLKK
jgi:hypothetical protein